MISSILSNLVILPFSSLRTNDMTNREGTMNALTTSETIQLDTSTKINFPPVIFMSNKKIIDANTILAAKKIINASLRR